MIAGLRKTLHVAGHEFRRYVTRRGFLAVVFGLPLLLIAVSVATVLILTARAGDPIGVVDHSGRLLDPAAYSQTLETGDAPLRAFAAEADARAALESEEIQAYAVIPAGYPESADVELYHNGDDGSGPNGGLHETQRDQPGYFACYQLSWAK